MIIETIGFSGMILILLAFIMNKAHKWREDGLAYDLVNSLGSLLLTAYSVILKSYPFVILNAVWFIVSIRDVVLGINKSKKKNANHKKRRGV